MKHFIKYNLKFFGNGDGADGGTDGSSSAAGESNTGAGGGDEAAVGGESSRDKKTDKTYSEAEKNQAIEDAIKARFKEKASDSKKQPGQQQQTAEQPDYDAKISAMQTKIITSEIKATLAAEGIKAEKLPYALKLIDASKVATDGELDEAALKIELEALFKAFPELKTADEQKPKGFKIGSGGSETKTTQSEISRIFGNSK